jgi:hypothetical protein
LKTRFNTLLAFVLLFCSASVSRATTYVWYGNYNLDNPYYGDFNYNWNDSINWYPIGVPGSSDTAIITNAGSIVYLNNTTSVSNIVLGVPNSCTNNATVALYIQGNIINLYGQLTVNPCNNFNFDSGVINGVGTNATLSGDVTMTGSGQISGTINVGPNGVFSIVSGVDHNIPSFTLNNYGTVAWSAGRIRGGGLPGTVINNYGIWDSQGDLTFNTDYGADGFVFNNFGIFRKSAGTNSTVLPSIPFNNSGVVDVETGTVTLTGGGVLSGGSETGLGTLLLSGGGYALNGMTTTTNLLLAGGYLYGTTVINGALTWVVGNWNSTGSVLLTTNSLLNIVSASDHDLGYTSFTNYGTVAWSGPGRVRGGGVPGTQIYNYGLWDAQGDWTLNDDFGGDGTVFNNFGTLRKSTGTGNTTLVGVYLSNTGTLDIESGTVSLNGSASLTSGTQTGAGTLLMAAGGFTLGGMTTTPNTVLSGGVFYGDNIINGGLVWVSGDWINASSVTIATNSTVNIVSASDHNLGYINFTNYGTFSWNAGRVRGGGIPGTAIYNYGLWDVQDDLVLNDDYGGDGTVFNNFGTFRKSGGTNTAATVTGVYFANTGLMDIQAGNLVMSGALANNGILNIASGYVALNAGATLNGGTQTGAGLLQFAAGSFNINGTATGTNVQMAGGTLYGSNYLSGGLTWLGGNWNPGTSVTIPTNRVLSIGSAADHNLPGCTLNNFGTVAWSGGRLRGGGVPGTVYNNYGLWDSQGDLILNDDSGGAGSVFNNYGTFRKSAGTGITTVTAGVPFSNTGLMDVQIGNVSLNDGFSSTGTINIVSGYVSLNNGGVLTGGVQTGAGLLQLAVGSFNVNGLTTTTNLQMTGGALYGTNFFTSGLYWFGGNWNSANLVTIPTNTVLNVLSTADHDLASCTLNNYGTVTWTAGRLRGGGNPATVYNNFGLWDSQSDLTFNSDLGLNGYVFNNFGTFLKSGGTNSTTLVAGATAPNFKSSGLVNVATGSLVLADGGTFSAGSVTGAGYTYLSAGNFSFKNTTTTTKVWQAGGNLVGANVINGGFIWNNGTWNSASSVTILSNSAVYAVSAADHDLASCTVSNLGAFNWVSGRLRGGGNPGTMVQNFGLWDAQSDYAFNSDLGLSGFVFNNLGTFRKSGGSSGTTFSPSGGGSTFNNHGTVSNLTTGPVYLNGGGIFSAGSISGLAVLGGGSFNINGTVTSTNVQETGGYLYGSNVLSGGFVWAGANWDSVSSIVVSPNTELDIVTSADHDLASCTLNNFGRVEWLGGRLRGGGNPGTVINNNGVWDVQCDYALNSDLGLNGIAFNNAGKFRKFNTTGTTSWVASGGSTTFNDLGGSVELDSGTLSIAGSFYTPVAGLTIGVGGTNSGQYGSLIVSQVFFVNGPLTVFLTNNFLPYKPEQFTIVSSALDSGVFNTAALAAGLGINYTNNSVYLVATNSAPPQIFAQASSGSLLFSFSTLRNQNYTVQLSTNLASGNWVTWFSIPGNGATQQFALPITNTVAAMFLRISEP